MAKYSLLFRLTLLPSNVMVISGSTGYREKFSWIISLWNRIFNGNDSECLPKVILLLPSPWIGNTRTRPEILYGPTKYKAGPFTLIEYFPTGSFWKPLKMANTMLNYENCCLSEPLKESKVWMQTNVSLVNSAFDSPIKSTSLNFNSIFTGDSAPCLIPMLGMWRGSIGIKFIPLCPSKKWMSRIRYNLLKND